MRALNIGGSLAAAAAAIMGLGGSASLVADSLSSLAVPTVKKKRQLSTNGEKTYGMGLRYMTKAEIANQNPADLIRAKELSDKGFTVKFCTRVSRSKTYRPNGKRECARRLRQIEGRV